MGTDETLPVAAGATASGAYDSGTRNIMLTLAYDGTRYQGWQVQPNGESVQSCVESAVQKLTGESRRVYCAGRTDAGVHAAGQIANFWTNSGIPAVNLRRGLQRFLPDDVIVVSVRDVALNFHATYSAVSKLYRYVLSDAEVIPPFLIRYVHRSRFQLNHEDMAVAAGYLQGTHDFRCFESEYPNKSTSIRTVTHASVQRLPYWNPWQASHGWSTQALSVPDAAAHQAIVFDIAADGFLYNMVRAIVGTLIEIGRGKRSPKSMQDVIQSRDRSFAGITAPACGLMLMHVDYPPELLDRELQGSRTFCEAET